MVKFIFQFDFECTALPVNQILNQLYLLCPYFVSILRQRKICKSFWYFSNIFWLMISNSSHGRLLIPNSLEVKVWKYILILKKDLKQLLCFSDHLSSQKKYSKILHCISNILPLHFLHLYTFLLKHVWSIKYLNFIATCFHAAPLSVMPKKLINWLIFSFDKKFITTSPSVILILRGHLTTMWIERMKKTTLFRFFLYILKILGFSLFEVNFLKSVGKEKSQKNTLLGIQWDHNWNCQKVWSSYLHFSKYSRWSLRKSSSQKILGNIKNNQSATVTIESVPCLWAKCEKLAKNEIQQIREIDELYSLIWQTLNMFCRENWRYRMSHQYLAKLYHSWSIFYVPWVIWFESGLKNIDFRQRY